MDCGFFFLAVRALVGVAARERRTGVKVVFEAVPLCKRFGFSEAHPAIRACWSPSVNETVWAAHVDKYES